MKKQNKLTGEPCIGCGEPTAAKILHIIDGPCHGCGEQMKIAYITSEPMFMLRGHSRIPASKFTPAEVEISKTKGVRLQVHYSKTKEQSYLANTCGKCGNFSGDHFLFEDYIIPASYGNLASEEIKIGQLCEKCDDIDDEE